LGGVDLGPVAVAAVADPGPERAERLAAPAGGEPSSRRVRLEEPALGGDLRLEAGCALTRHEIAFVSALHEPARQPEALVEDGARGGDEDDVPVVLWDLGQEAQELLLPRRLEGAEDPEGAADRRLEVVEGCPVVEAVRGRGQGDPVVAGAAARLGAHLRAGHAMPTADPA